MIASIQLAAALPDVSESVVSSPVGVLATLSGVCAFFFWLEKRTQWRFFQVVPPLIFIYFVPLILSSQGVLPTKSPVYDAMRQLVLPMLLVLLLLKMNLRGIAILGRGLGVMLFGTLGVMVGAMVGLAVVNSWVAPDAWKAYGSLSASWVGGSANMAAVGEIVHARGPELGLALIADAGIAYLIWLPILLRSRKYAEPFSRFTGVDRDKAASLRDAPQWKQEKPRVPTIRDYLILIAAALAATWVADLAANWIVERMTVWNQSAADSVSAELNPLVDRTTWHILLITAIGIGLSFTPLSRVAGSHELAMTFLFLYVARMGASAELEGVAGQVVPFLVGALICIFIHGAFCLLGAKLFRTDIHTAAIASAANVGGAATATIVAEYHDPALLPAAILMALLGYAIGNYSGYATALLCQQIQLWM